MRIAFLGHASFLLETGECTLLVGPFISGIKLAAGKVDAGKLQPDCILLTLAHQDHTLDVEAIAGRTGAL